MYNIVDVFNPEYFEVYPMFVLNIASPIISIAFFETERILVVLSYKGVHTFSACCPPYEMLLPLLIPGSPALTPPIAALTLTNSAQTQPLNSLSETKSPLGSPTISIMSQATWQLPVSAPATMASGNYSVQSLNVQSHSLPQMKSSIQQIRPKQKNIRAFSFLQVSEQHNKDEQLLESKKPEKKFLIKQEKEQNYVRFQEVESHIPVDVSEQNIENCKKLLK